MPTSVPNFTFLALLVFEINTVSRHLMWGLLPPAIPRMLKHLRVLKILGEVKQPAKFQHCISIHHAATRICYCNLFPQAFHYKYPKMGYLGVLRVKMWKYCVQTPKRHYPAWICVCWCIACQNRFNSLSSRSVERFCIQRNKFKQVRQ